MKNYLKISILLISTLILSVAGLKADGLDLGLEDGLVHVCKGVSADGTSIPKTKCLACIKGHLMTNVSNSYFGGKATSKSAIIDEYFKEFGHTLQDAEEFEKNINRITKDFLDWLKNHKKNYPY